MVKLPDETAFGARPNLSTPGLVNVSRAAGGVMRGAGMIAQEAKEAGKGMQAMGAALTQGAGKLKDLKDDQDQLALIKAKADWKMGLVGISEKYRDDTDHETLVERAEFDIGELRKQVTGNLTGRAQFLFTQDAQVDEAQSRFSFGKQARELWGAEQRAELTTSLSALTNDLQEEKDPIKLQQKLSAAKAMIDKAVANGVIKEDAAAELWLSTRVETGKAMIVTLPWAEQVELLEGDPKGIVKDIPPAERTKMLRTARTKLEGEKVLGTAQDHRDKIIKKYDLTTSEGATAALADARSRSLSGNRRLQAKTREKLVSLVKEAIDETNKLNNMRIEEDSQEAYDIAIGDKNLAFGSDQEEARNEIDAVADPKVRAAAKKKLNTAIAETKRIESAKDEEAMSSALAWIDGGNSIADLDSTTKDRIIRAGQLDELVSYENWKRTGIDPPMNQAAWDLYRRLQDLPTEKFIDENLSKYASKLSASIMKQLVDKQSALKRGVSDVPLKVQLKKVFADFKWAGSKSTGKKRKMDIFEFRVREAITELERQQDKPATTEQRQDIINRMGVKVYDPSWFNWVPGQPANDFIAGGKNLESMTAEEKARYRVDIDDIPGRDLRRLKAWVKSRGLDPDSAEAREAYEAAAAARAFGEEERAANIMLGLLKGKRR